MLILTAKIQKNIDTDKSSFQHVGVGGGRNAMRVSIFLFYTPSNYKADPLSDEKCCKA